MSAVFGLIFIVFLLISVALLTLVERKVMAAIQLRRGPSVVGFWGIAQPFADGLKLMLKETIIPTAATRKLFILGPILTFTFMVGAWWVMPFRGVCFAYEFIHFDTSLFYVLVMSSLGVYGIIGAGWASNSKYAFLGAVRSASQLISYEVSFGLIILHSCMFAGSVQLRSIVYSQAFGWNCGLLLLPCFMFFVSILAETNRAPFDLPEAEGELVAGYNVEYSGVGFALFFLAEYGSMILMSSLFCILFFGAWFFPFVGSVNFVFDSFVWGFKVSFVLWLFVLVRAVFPRFRYDQLMYLGWKTFLPLAASSLFFFGTLGWWTVWFDLFPYASFVDL